MYYRETSAARTELAQGTEAKVRTQNFRKAPQLSSCDVALELPPSRYRNISDVNGSPFPAYSDEIVQDLHLLPFYPLSCSKTYSGTDCSLIYLLRGKFPHCTSIYYI